MYFRIETLPKKTDPTSDSLLRALELSEPSLKSEIKQARSAQVAHVEIDEKVYSKHPKAFWDHAISEIFSDPVLTHTLYSSSQFKALAHSIFDGSSDPSKTVGLERRFRKGVTDNIGRTIAEAFQIVTGETVKAQSGSLWLVEFAQTASEALAKRVALQVLYNPLIEAFQFHSSGELKEGIRFDRKPGDGEPESPATQNSQDSHVILAKVPTFDFSSKSDSELLAMSDAGLWALNLAEMKAIQAYFKKEGRPATDVEIEVLAQTWSEHCKHKIFGATIHYSEVPGAESAVSGLEIPARVDSLFKTTIRGTTEQLPRPWLLSVFEDNAGIVAFDDEDAVCIKVETHNSPSALDPVGGAMTGIVGVNRDILGCGLGARPIFNTDVFCVADPDYSQPLPDRLMHPRRILAGVRKGVEHGGNQSGIPTINGALAFDDRYLGKPLVYCGTGGILPRKILGRACELKEIESGDRVVMLGGRIGRDGIHGATFSSLALDENSPVTAVQLGDPITQKRVADFLLEARDLGLYRAVTDNGAGGLSSSVGEMARLSGGAVIDVKKAKTKALDLKPFELVVSESQERMTLAVPKSSMKAFSELADRRGVEISDLGEFTNSGKFEVYYGSEKVSDLSLEFLHEGCPKMEMKAVWSGLKKPAGSASSVKAPEINVGDTLLRLLSRNTIASKEWLVRQYDHEVQGTSVVKPLNAIPESSPNDGGVIAPKLGSSVGLTVGCGLQPWLSDFDAALMAEASLDEAIRNVLAVGAEYGRGKDGNDSVFALIDNFCWPDPVSNPAFAADLVRACFAMKRAALFMGLPFISGKDSMKNDYRGKLSGKPVQISVPPTLLITAMARVPDIAFARTSFFKNAGDRVYLLGPSQTGLRASEFARAFSADAARLAGLPGMSELPKADWAKAKTLYSWMGSDSAKVLSSAHDLSEGGLLVAIAESALGRGLGVEMNSEAVQSVSKSDFAQFSFGEGFHRFVVSFDGKDTAVVRATEAEWTRLGIDFQELGSVTNDPHLLIPSQNVKLSMSQISKAWKKEGYWE